MWDEGIEAGGCDKEDNKVVARAFIGFECSSDKIDHACGRFRPGQPDELLGEEGSTRTAKRMAKKALRERIMGVFFKYT